MKNNGHNDKDNIDTDDANDHVRGDINDDVNGGDDDNNVDKDNNDTDNSNDIVGDDTNTDDVNGNDDGDNDDNEWCRENIGTMFSYLLNHSSSVSEGVTSLITIIIMYEVSTCIRMLGTVQLMMWNRITDSTYN